MTQNLVLLLMCVLDVATTGLTALVETQQEVTAALGEDARLTCRLTQTKHVVQITWEKLLPTENKFLAAYSNMYGLRFNPQFKDKLSFAETELQRSSIVLKNLTEEDEGCYRCVFNAYPEGALMGRTCLQVYVSLEEWPTSFSYISDPRSTVPPTDDPGSTGSSPTGPLVLGIRIAVGSLFVLMTAVLLLLAWRKSQQRSSSVPPTLTLSACQTSCDQGLDRVYSTLQNPDGGDYQPLFGAAGKAAKLAEGGAAGSEEGPAIIYKNN